MTETSQQPTQETPTVQSPPPSGTPAKEEEPTPRARLHELAGQLRQTGNRRALMEYLRLRRRA